MKAKLIALLKLESTWKGIIGILTAAGAAISPDLAVSIITLGIGLISVINVADDK
jgi:Sec-independent protein secretion pathway component TatC